MTDFELSVKILLNDICRQLKEVNSDIRGIRNDLSDIKEQLTQIKGGKNETTNRYGMD